MRFIPTILVAVLFGYAALSHSENTKTAPEPITQEQAVAIVHELPEFKAWSGYIERKSAGKAHAALLVIPETPEKLSENKYWSVVFYESQPTHFHRWQTFLVRIDGKEILVDDVTTGDYVSIEQWRQQQKPMERINEHNKTH